MTEQPQPTPPGFSPVPAIPITVEFASKGAWRLRTAGGVFSGATLRDAVDAAQAARKDAP